MLVGPKNVFGPDPNPKNSPKSAKKAPNLAKLKTKKYGCTSKTPKMIVYTGKSEKVFEPDPNQKNC